jgi:nitroimidazol reductase NimA-like FMN-containing flavoprotein (pyridoxamine 5'-phosphate oxidase superfamily)
VIAFGRAVIIDDEVQKKAGLDVIMSHHGASGGEYDEKKLQRISVIKVVLESMTGKQSL